MRCFSGLGHFDFSAPKNTSFCTDKATSLIFFFRIKANKMKNKIWIKKHFSPKLTLFESGIVTNFTSYTSTSALLLKEE